MKGDGIFINDDARHSPSQEKKVSGTDNLGASGTHKLPSLESSIRMHDQTHGETDINIKHLAQSGKAGFLSAIKNFFMGIFTKSQSEISEKVRVKVAGQKIVVKGERFRGMLEALPKGKRIEEIWHLSDRITERLNKGEEILTAIFSGKALPPATTKEVSNLMLFIQLRHEVLHPKESFTNGAYSIEDPDGRLADFLDSCKEGYNRSSSHLEGLQNSSLGHGKRNAMRGIDIPGGVTTGLLDKRGTIHYGSIPQQENVQGSTRRLFIQTERHGCRLCPRNFKFWTKSFWVNTSGRAHRSMQFSDIGRAIKHACNYFEKSDEKSAIKYRSDRSEKLRGLSPKDIAETFKGLSLCEELEELKPYFSKDGTKRLPENARLVQTLEWLDIVAVIAKQNHTQEKWHLDLRGLAMDKLRQEDYSKFFKALDSIKSKLIDGMYTNNPNQKDRNLDKLFSWFLTSTKLDHPDRLGNEVMLSSNDLLSSKR